jgi:predicted amidohydrolase
MNDRFIAAVVQLNSGEDKPANLARAIALVEQAAGQGATLVALPEMFNCLGRFSTVVENAEPIPGPSSEAMRGLAARLGITLLAGSLCERSCEPGKAFNTSLLFSPQGEELARYRKIHLFDADLPGRVAVTESHWILAGNEIVAAETPLGTVGLSICYDLRFPELYRHLADRDARILFAPSAFTFATGKDHWEILLRARAIENQTVVIAPNQCGRHGPELTTYGHSMIVDAWGTVLARAGDDEGIACAEIDLARLAEVRAQLPALEHRRRLDCGARNS